MVSHFYPTDNSTGLGKNGACPIFAVGLSHFYHKLHGKDVTSLKAIFLIKKKRLI